MGSFAEPDLHVMCAAEATLEDLGVAGDFIGQLTQWVPARGPMDVRGWSGPAGVEIRYDVHISDRSAIDAWLVANAFAGSDGRWRSPSGAIAALTGDRLVVTRPAAATVPAGGGPLPALEMPKSGCRVAFRSEPMTDLLPAPFGVAVDLSGRTDIGMRLDLPRPAAWRGKRTDAPRARGDFQPDARIRWNVADTAALLRGLPKPDELHVDLAWLDAIGGALRPGTEMVVHRQDWLTVFPVRGDAGAILAKMGKVPEDGVFAPPHARGYLRAVDGAIVATSKRAWLDGIEGKPSLFGDEADWRAPGVHVALREDGGTTRVDLTASRGGLAVAASSGKLQDLEARVLRRDTPSRTEGSDPTWPPAVPGSERSTRCEARFVLDAGGRVQDLAVTGCAPGLADAVRIAARTWRYAGGPPPLVSLHEVRETVEMQPPPPPLRDAPPRAAVTSYEGTPSGLRWADVVVGTGVMPQPGQDVVIEWSAWREDGAPVGSTYEGHDPLTFRLGGGWGLPAWEEALATMRVGGRRQIVAPPYLAYGEAGLPPRVPPNETLTFEIELLAVDPPTPAVEVFPGRGGAATVSVVGPAILGPYDPAQLHLVLPRFINQIRYCYERERTKRPSLRGRITVDLEMAPDGTIASAVPRSARELDAVGACVAGRFLRMQFPAGHDYIEIRYEFSFEP